MTDEKIYIVVPAFNEEKRIAETLASLHDAGYSDIIVVNDGSEDSTAAVAENYAHVLTHVINRGMGAALETGTRYALRKGANIIVHFDADGQHQASDISKVIEPLINQQADIVVGSRYLGTNSVPVTKKYLIHKPAIIFQNIVTGVKLTDVHNGFRAMNRKAADSIRISQDRMAHNTEIISQIKQHKLRHIEVPVTILYAEYGQGFLGGISILKELFTKFLIK